MPGAGHSYLKQVCGPDGADARAALGSVVARMVPAVQERLVELLRSLDNRRFFQGFSEAAALAALEPAGWAARALQRPGARIVIGRPTGPAVALSILAFLHQTRPQGEQETRRRLVDALSRVASRRRFAVLVRRWLPHDFDPEPVRRAIEIWLGQVHGGKWDGRYAAYEDEHLSLEFCLTGENASARQTTVALTLGPFFAHRALEVLEPRVVQELDRPTGSPPPEGPVLLACVADQPWAINEGYVRDFLYGRARSIRSEGGVREVEFGASRSVSVFRDPLYTHVAGVLFLDRRPSAPLEMRARAWLNPWASQPLSPEDLGIPSFAEAPAATAAARALPPIGAEAAMPGASDAVRVLRWQEAPGGRVTLA